jgi:hypothetical protein
VESSSMFIVLAPSLDHLIKHGDTTAEYVTWRKRGWCRTEAVAKALSCAKTVGPTVVIHSTTNIFMGQTLLGTQPIGDGDFGCCEMNHKLTLPDGSDLDWGEARPLRYGPQYPPGPGPPIHPPSPAPPLRRASGTSFGPGL